PAPPPPSAGRLPKAALGIVSLGLIIGGSLFSGLPIFIAVAYAAMSLLALATYAIDKSAAQSGRRRIPENTLHLFALLGGWPGALVAQQWLRHKSVKTGFLGVFWLTVFANLALLGGMLATR
ncbi:MAG: DUF1294 domain-containing protein, partial [Rhizobium sp.]|nr:DUF1294 domain-containing protein [Rhizobium sp.]